MVLTAKIEDSLDIPVQTFFQLFLEQTAFEQSYHKKLAHEGVVISPWETVGDGFRRTIDFETPFNGPAIVKKMLGKVSSTHVKATQFYSWSADGRELTMSQKNVVMGVPMADCFVVEETCTVAPDGAASCKYVSVARCEFTGRLPGAKGSIEKTMFKESENAQSVWAALAKTIVDKHKGVATPADDAVDSDRETEPTTPDAASKAPPSPAPAAGEPVAAASVAAAAGAGEQMFEVSIVAAQAVKSSEEREHTEYVVEVRGPVAKWIVSRRYRQFDLLHRTLTKKHGRKLKAQMPKKQMFGSMAASVVDLRRKGLEQYLKDVLASDEIGRGDPDVAAFLELNDVWRAAGEGDVRALKFVIETLKVDINARDKCGDPPLVRAAARGREECALLLIEKGADINGQGQAGESPLVAAATQGLEKVTMALIAKRALIDCRDRVGGTPLYYAALNGHLAIVKMLITAGADTNAQDKAGETAIYAASHHGHVEVVEALLNAGADPHFAAIHADAPAEGSAAGGSSNRGSYGAALASSTPGTEPTPYASQLIAAFIRAPPADGSEAARKLRSAVALELELTRRLIGAKMEALGAQLGPGMEEARKTNAALQPLEVMSKRLASQIALLRAHIDEAIDAALPDIQGVSLTAPASARPSEGALADESGAVADKAAEASAEPSPATEAPSHPPSVKSMPAALRFSMSPSSSRKSQVSVAAPASAAPALSARVRSKTLLVPLVPFKSLHNLSASLHPVSTIKFARGTADILAFASTNGSIAVVRVSTEELKTLHTLTGHVGAVNDFDISPDGTQLLSGGADKSIRLWSLADGRCLSTVPVNREVNGVLFHPYHPDFYVYGNNKNALVSASTDGKRCQKLVLKAAIKSIAFDSTGELLFAGDAKGTITAVTTKVQAGSLRLKETGETVVSKGYAVTSIQYKPASQRAGTEGFLPTEMALLLVNSCDNVLRVFIVQNNGQLRIFKQFPVFQETTDLRSCFGSSATGANEELLVFSGSEDGRVHTFDLCRRETPCVNKLSGHAKTVLSVAWSALSRLLASADAAGNVIVWGHE